MFLLPVAAEVFVSSLPARPATRATPVVNDKPLLLAAAAALALLPAALSAAETRAATATTTQPQPQAQAALGSLVIVGGGTLPDAVRDRFLELGGGKKAHIVVIPTASEYGHKKGSFS